MALADFIGDVVAYLNTGRTVAVASAIGEEHKAEYGAPPRLVWVPTTDTFGPAVRVGANPKSVAVRNAGLECHIWGSTLGDAEALLNDVVVAAKRCAGGGLELRSGESQNEGQLEASGFLYILNLSVQIPITEPPAVTVRPETTTTSTDIA